MPTQDPTHPNANEVARLLRARTKDTAGKEVGDFTEDTRPTWSEVDDLIDTAEGDVLAQTGSLLSDIDTRAARALVALRAAMLVELSYFPEQVRSDRSAYVEYKRLYDDGLAALLASIAEGGGEAGKGGEGFTYHSLPVVSETTATYYAGWQEVPTPEDPATWPDPFDPLSGTKVPVVERGEDEVRIGLPAEALHPNE